MDKNYKKENDFSSVFKFIKTEDLRQVQSILLIGNEIDIYDTLKL
jgi:hypothetical protein